MVGAVLVRDKVVLGVGHHRRYGGLHAEREALADCERRGNDARGATAYVTLEPCCHHGKQPPCTDALIEAGIARVVYARPDPHATSGGGAEVLRRAGVRYVILFRDLRDVAVSNYFYVCNTPWHPEYRHYHGRTVEEGLETFAERTLPAYVQWVRSWQANRDPERSLVFRYEELLADDLGCLRKMAALFELPGSDDELRTIAERNSFKAMSGGRERGEESGSSFQRKGQAGDWKNHFTPAITEVYRRVLGEFLVEFGYERSEDW